MLLFLVFLISTVHNKTAVRMGFLGPRLYINPLHMFNRLIDTVKVYQDSV